MRRISLSVTAIAFLLVVGVAAAQTTVPGPGIAVDVGTTGTKVAVSHQVTVEIPTVLAIQMRKVATAPDATIDFNITSTAYANAMFNATTIDPTTVNLKDVRVFTNDTNGASVGIGVSETSGPSSITGNLRFGGYAAASWSASVSPGRIATVLTGNQITYQPSGTEADGSYVLVVTYTATAQ